MTTTGTAHRTAKPHTEPLAETDTPTLADVLRQHCQTHPTLADLLRSYLGRSRPREHPANLGLACASEHVSRRGQV